ncbi:uncharacterized protein LOC135398075 [Ornithodoros turicata]|uniref:uncharacterized protein LOC135398075 n=1 Tax=Ornithodoros turicata TaxID=34597 RepID=UPI00313974B1
MMRISIVVLCLLTLCIARQFPDFRPQDTDTYQDLTDLSNYTTSTTKPEYPLVGNKVNVNPDSGKFGYGITCKSDEECASGLGLACIARRAALASRCDCARGTPIFIRDTDGVAKCVRGKHLYESCVSDLECAHHDKNMQCVDFLCYCPQPFVLADNQKCLSRKPSRANVLFGTLPTLVLLLTLLVIGAAYSYRRLSRATKEKESCVGPRDTVDASTDFLEWRPDTGSSVSFTQHRPRTSSAFQSSIDPRQRYYQKYGEHASWGYARIPKHPPRYIRYSKDTQANNEANSTFVFDDCSTLLEKKTCIAPIHQRPTTPLARSVDDTRSSLRYKRRRTSHRKINRGRNRNQDEPPTSKLPSSRHISYPKELKDLLLARDVLVNVEPIKSVITAGKTAFASQGAAVEDSCVNHERESIESSTKDPDVFSGSIRHNKATSRATGITIQTPPPQEPGDNYAVSEECVPTDRSTSQKMPSLIVTYRDLKYYASTAPFGTSPNTKSSYGESSGINSYPSKPSDISVSWTLPPGTCCQANFVDVASGQSDTIGGQSAVIGETGNEHGVTNTSGGEEMETEVLHGSQYEPGRTEQKLKEQLQLTMTKWGSRIISEPSFLPPRNVEDSHPTVTGTCPAREQILQPSDIKHVNLTPHIKSEPSSPNLTTKMAGPNIHLIDSTLIPSCLPQDVFSPEDRPVTGDSYTTLPELMSSGFDFVSLDINRASTEEISSCRLSASDNAGFERCSAKDDGMSQEWRNTPSRRARRSTTELSPSPQCQSDAARTFVDALCPATKLLSNEIAIHNRRINETKPTNTHEALLETRPATTLRPIAIRALPSFIVCESSVREASNKEIMEGSSKEEMRVSSEPSSCDADGDDPSNLVAVSIMSSRSESDLCPDIELDKSHSPVSSDKGRSAEHQEGKNDAGLRESANMLGDVDASTSDKERRISGNGSICSVHTQAQETISGHCSKHQQGQTLGRVSGKAFRAPFMELLALGNRHYYRERRNLSPVQPPSILDETLYILDKMRPLNSTPNFYMPHFRIAMHDVRDTIKPLKLQDLVLRQHPVLRAIMELHRGQRGLEGSRTHFSYLNPTDCLLAQNSPSVTETEHSALHGRGRVKSLITESLVTPEKVDMGPVIRSSFHNVPTERSSESAATLLSVPAGMDGGGTVAAIPTSIPHTRFQTSRSGSANPARRHASVLEETCFESLYNAVLLSQSSAAKSETQKRSNPGSSEQKRARRVSFPTELVSTPVASTSQDPRVSLSDSGVSKTTPYNLHRQQESDSTLHGQLLSSGLCSPEDHSEYFPVSSIVTLSPMEPVQTLSNVAKAVSCPPHSVDHKRSLPNCRTVSRRSVSFKETLSDSALRRSRIHPNNDKST